ncbi:MAG: tRNA preQ1(34) S-adenosylmethionine ribosyltransferase-isomerase QueA [candidate division Zixibacteria bacterium]|nr:tRNA preQ1(34) S-adenosylmethionine ribosyltransferase-isomerase QueA [candidate division Zixibacteria bacterium]
MDLALFDYELPKELIAQVPARRRDRSRLLIHDRGTGERRHETFPSILNHIKSGDVLVVNNTKVFKARLLGRKATGAKVEIFLVRRVDGLSGDCWEALARPSRRLSEGEEVLFDGGGWARLDKWLGRGRWRVVFRSESAAARIIAHCGHVPLPQYIRRDDSPSDLRRYQTVFASSDRTGAVAAPTAGFHFTKGLLTKLAERGVDVLQVTLHVGPGTFKPITVDNIHDHTVDPEWAELPSSVADRLNEVRAHGGKIFAVGTTSVRTLESAPAQNGLIQPFAEMVDLYIKPGHTFRFVDHLITNFHLPKSSLLVLVSAFAGRDDILTSYREAVREKYRFYSYGDAMLIL